MTTLVLNAGFEPHGFVSGKRAIVLVLTQKAEVLEESEEILRSVNLQLRVPAVIRLLRYVKVPYRRRAQLNLRSVLARDGGLCQYCGAKADSIDHVLPRSRGGRHIWENVVAACRSCNGKKDNKTLAELGWTLKRKPFAPKDKAWLVLAVAQVDPVWQPYLGPAL